MAVLIHLARPDEWPPEGAAAWRRLPACPPRQAVRVANLRFAAGGDLLAVALDGGAVLAVVPYRRGADGRFPRLPPELRDRDRGAGAGPMTAAEAVAVLDALDAAGVAAVVDGGWAVDAAAGRQTRPHADLDLCVDVRALDAALAALGARGYAVAADQRPTRVELAADAPEGPRVDVHPLAYDADGNGVQDLGGGAAFTYPAAGLAGTGRIGGRDVRCLTPELQLTCHLGYEPDEDDHDDVAVLAALTGRPPPPPYGA